jgi:hypothetical protein
MITDFLTLDQYHEICYENLRRARVHHISTPMIVNLGALVSCPSSKRFEDLVEVAFLSNLDLHLGDWATSQGVVGEVIEDGWKRYHYFILQRWIHVLMVFNLKFQLRRCNRHQDPATHIGEHHEVVMAQSSKLSFQSPADRLQFRGLR